MTLKIRTTQGCTRQFYLPTVLNFALQGLREEKKKIKNENSWEQCPCVTH